MQIEAEYEHNNVWPRGAGSCKKRRLRLGNAANVRAQTQINREKSPAALQRNNLPRADTRFNKTNVTRCILCELQVYMLCLNANRVYAVSVI
jgi:hypothetical protein